MSQQYAAVRAGLARVLSAFPEWRTEPLVLLRNRLLDECGGDARPLIALLMRAAELGVPDRIAEWGGSGVSWATLRGSLVVGLVADAFLRPEMATWAIDTWGIALLGAETLGLEQPSFASGRPISPQGAGTVDGTPRPAANAPASGRSPTARTAASPPAPRTPGSSARSGAPAATGPASAQRSPRPTANRGQQPPTSPWSSGPGPSWQSMTRVSLGVIALGLAYLVVQVTGAARRREATRQASAAAAPARPPAASAAARANAAADDRPAPATEAGSGRTDTSATSLSGIARGALPSAANDPSRLMRVQPPTRARGTVGPGAAVLENQVALLATTRADRIALRSGRTLTGRVEVVRASVVVFRDAESGLRYEFAKRDIVEITTEFGTKVRFSAEGDPENERRSPLVMRGLAGSYRVSYTFEKVQGSAECQATAASGLAPDVLTIEHIPGTDTLTLVLRSGSRYYGVVDADGLFATALAIQGDQAMEASAYTSRLSGRFTERGFDGTVNLIAYRRVRGGRDIACHTTLAAAGERIDAGRSSSAPR